MLCKKCGHELENGVNFCDKCGAPTEVVNNAEKSVTPKQPISPKSKKIIILSSIGAVALVVVLVVLFAVVLPGSNKIDPSNYIKVNFDNASLLYETYAEADILIDSEAICEDLADDDLTAEVIDAIVNRCSIYAEVKDGYKPSKNNSMGQNTVRELESDDVIIVTLEWDLDEVSEELVTEREKELGITFDKEDKTFEIKVSDALAENDIKLKEPIYLDMFEYIDENNLTYVTGLKGGVLGFHIAEFEFEHNGYTISKEEDSSVLQIKDSDGDEFTFPISIIPEGGSNGILDDGDEVLVEFESTHITGTELFLTETSHTYTLEGNEVMDSEAAKANVDAIKVLASEQADTLTWMDGNIVVDELYYLEDKTATELENRIVVIYHSDAYKNKYYSCYLENVYVSENSVECESVNSILFSESSTIKKAQENCGYLTDKDYNATQIY